MPAARCTVALAVACMAAAQFPLTRVAVWPLGPSVVGRIDHFAAGEGRVYVNELAANATLVVDATTGAIVASVGPTANPQGCAIAPAPLVLAVASTLDGVLHAYRTADFAPLYAVPLGVDADNVRFDAAASRFVVGYGDKNGAWRADGPRAFPPAGIVELDAALGTVARIVELPVHAESLQLEAGGRRAFVNVPEYAGGVVAVVDRAAAAVVAYWNLTHPVTGARLGGNYPLALVPAERLLLVGCRAPPVLALVDADTGRTLAAADSVGDTDDVWYDAATAMAYQTGGEGRVVAFRVVGGGAAGGAALEPLGGAPTAALARTSYFDAAARRLFVAVPRVQAGDPEAALWVFDADSR